MPNHIRRTTQGWVADFVVDGKRKQLRRRTKAEASDAMGRAISEAALLADHRAQEKPFTLKEARLLTIQTRWQGLACLETASGYSRDVVEFFGEDTPLESITPLKVKELREYLKGKGNSAGTINYKVSTLSSMFNDAAEYQQIGAVPKLPKRLRMDNTKDRYLSMEEELAFKELFGLFGFPMYVDLVTFLVETGCRFSEAQRSITAHVNTRNQTISFLKTKNSNPRTIKCTKTLWEVVSRRLTSNARGHLFPGLDYKAFEHQWNRCKGRMGLAHDEQLTIHCCRHTMATRMITHVSLPELMHYGGWKTLAAVQRYIHLNVSSLGNAVAALENEREQLTLHCEDPHSGRDR